MTKAVTESTTGTMAEAEGTSTPEAEVKTPEPASKVSPKEEKEKVEEKPTVTQSQLQEFIHTATSEAGRLKIDADTERDTAKSEVTRLTSELEGTTEDIKNLEAKLDDMASEDPKKFDVVKELKEARELKGKLKTATDDLASEVKVHEGTVKSANDTMLEIAIWEVATEYKGGDPVRLKALCVTLGVTDEAKLREVAGNLWEKAEGKAPAKEAEGEVVPKEKLNLDPGDTHGGGEETEEQKLKKRYPKMFSK